MNKKVLLNIIALMLSFSSFMFSDMSAQGSLLELLKSKLAQRREDIKPNNDNNTTDDWKDGDDSQTQKFPTTKLSKQEERLKDMVHVGSESIKERGNAIAGLFNANNAKREKTNIVTIQNITESKKINGVQPQTQSLRSGKNETATEETNSDRSSMHKMKLIAQTIKLLEQSDQLKESIKSIEKDIKDQLKKLLSSLDKN